VEPLDHKNFQFLVNLVSFIAKLFLFDFKY
jgi:hypothetical protein